MRSWRPWLSKRWRGTRGRGAEREEEVLTGFMIAEVKYAFPEIQNRDQRTRKATTMARCGFLVDLGCARAPCSFPRFFGLASLAAAGE
jgi:hypothetical protein